MPLFLVTGGCGFIGSHLSDRLLADGNRVRIVDDLSTGRTENLPVDAEFLEGDVQDAALLGRAMDGVDGCFHLAAVASVERANREWLATHRINLSATIAVMEAARDRGKLPVVYASSAAVYGNSIDLPIGEDCRKSPLSAYGADKLGCEQQAFVAGRVHGVPTCGLRFFNVYGPRQDPSSPYSGVISIFCERILRGEEITVRGDGLQSRDFVFVADVVRALVEAMQRTSPEGKVYNVCSGQETTILDLARMIAHLVDVPLDCRFAPAREGDIRHSLGDHQRAMAELGFRARVPLQEGLTATLGLERLASPFHPASAPSPARAASLNGHAAPG